jgi:hypothetical protein
VPENGLIALNVPLDQLRLGSNSTRTTHPYYMARWNDLLDALGIDGDVQNSFWDKTKGEMAASCRNPALLKNLRLTRCPARLQRKGAGKDSVLSIAAIVCRA